MTAVSTRLLRTGGYLIEHAATGELIREDTSRPDTYGTVRRRARFQWDWKIWTTGSVDRELAWGTTWTRSGAWVKANAAAHRSGGAA